jgi:hypothetical protein
VKNRANGAASRIAVTTAEPNPWAQLELSAELARTVENVRNKRTRECSFVRVALPLDVNRRLYRLRQRVVDEFGLKPWQGRNARVKAMIAMDLKRRRGLLV